MIWELPQGPLGLCVGDERGEWNTRQPDMANVKKPGEQKEEMGFSFFFSFPNHYRLVRRHIEEIIIMEALYVLQNNNDCNLIPP